MLASVSLPSIFFGHAQQFRLRGGAVSQPAFAVLAHGLHAALERGRFHVRFRCAVVDLRADLLRRRQQLVDADPALVAGLAAMLAADRVPQAAVVTLAMPHSLRTSRCASTPSSDD